MASKQSPPGGRKPDKSTPSKAKSAKPQSEKRTAQDGARAASMEAGKALQRILDAAPGAKTAARLDAAALAVAEKVLEDAAGLEIHVPNTPVTKEHVRARIDELRRTLSTVEPRAFGDPVKLGDEVQIDITGYVDGNVFVAQLDAWYEAKPNPLLPGVFEAIVGARPPDQRLVPVRLPDFYPNALLRGKPAAFAIAVKSAQKRTMYKADDQRFLYILGKGKNLKELEQTVLGELTVERGRWMVEHAKILLLRELYVRSTDRVPDDLVESELHQRWKNHIGEALIRQGVTVEEQKRSFGDFASDPNIRAESRRAVWEARMLEALADDLGVESSDDELMKMLSEIAGDDAARNEIRGMISADASLKKSLLKGLRHRRAIVALMSRAKIFFDAPPTPPEKMYVALPDKGGPRGRDDASGSTQTASRGLKGAPPSPRPPPPKGPPAKGPAPKGPSSSKGR